MAVTDLAGRIAVVTGGGDGMGRELVRQLAAAGAHVAACDLDAETLKQSNELATSQATSGVRITTHVGDVTDAGEMSAGGPSEGRPDEVMSGVDAEAP